MNKFAPLFIVLAAVLWGVDGIVLRPSLFTLPVTLVVFIESIIVAILLLPILIKNVKNLKELLVKDWLSFAGVALFGGAIGTMAITRALFYVDFVNLSIVILIQKLQPVFALALAAIILKEKLNRTFFFWAAIAIIAAYFMTFGLKLPTIQNESKILYAALYSLLAAFSFGFSTVLSKRALKNVSFELGTYLRFIISAFIMFFFVLLSGNFGNISQITSHQALVFLLIAFSTGGPAIFFYYYGLKHTTASSSTILELAFPLSAILLEYFLRDNFLSAVQWAGAIVLFYSITKIIRIDRN